MAWAMRVVLCGLLVHLGCGQGDASESCSGDDEESSLLQMQGKAAWGRKPATTTTTTTTHPPFREPPEVRGPLTLTLEVKRLCVLNNICFYTRVYGTDTIAPDLPGPTIRVKPGGSLSILLKNNLKLPNPGANWLANADPLDRFYYINNTNLHTHGLHIGAPPGQDDVWAVVPPGKSKQYTFEVVNYHMAGTHWYHPHRHHSTAVQAGGGLHGAMIVDDPPNSLPPQVASMEEKVIVLSLVDGSLAPADSGATQGAFGLPYLESQSGGNLWKSSGKYVDFKTPLLLVNGLYNPKMSIASGKWYRFRMIFASVGMVVRAFPAVNANVTCEMQLLAKDGIYLNEAPRTVEILYFASGNRVDIAFRCQCLGNSSSCSAHLVSASTMPQENIGSVDKKIRQAKKKQDLGTPEAGAFASIGQAVLEQDFLYFDIEAGTAEAPIAPFSVTRPCYLADLTGTVVPKSNQGHIVLPTPPNFMIQYGTSLLGPAKGQVMLDMDMAPLAFLRVGEVYEWNVGGPANDVGEGLAMHPFHTHVSPFQLASIESDDNFWMPGDWMDTLLIGTGQAVIKLQTNSFAGHMILHCHILDHEDMGMMAYFNITGKEGGVWPGAEKVDPTCYRQPLGLHAAVGRDLDGRDAQPDGVGYKMWPTTSSSELLQQRPAEWVLSEPGSTCHTACANLGGCIAKSASAEDIQVALQTTRATCDSIVESAEPYAPSVLPGGACIRGFSGRGHCAVVAPEGVSRLCRCRSFQRYTRSLHAAAAVAA